jgi:predicted GNAT family acetyltransferase
MNNQLTTTTEHNMTQIENTQSFNSLMKTVMADTPYLPEADVTVTVFELAEEDRNEVLAFLAERPRHTVCMTGFIRDNGLVSPHNRGTFYGCRNSEDRLEGVALIGHATLIEARTSRAMREFGLVAQTHTRSHMIMGEVEAVEEFWNYYADEGQEMRRACRELLFELRHAMEVSGEIGEMRRANLGDLDQIVPVQAAMAEFESGVNPFVADPEGFRARCARRIEMGRVWVLEADGKLVFKADILADTPDVIYLEGVWVAPAERGKGIGRKCMRQLCRDLLTRSKSVCLLVNEESERAQTFYRMCNFKMRGVYDSIFLRQG